MMEGDMAASEGRFCIVAASRERVLCADQRKGSGSDEVR